MQVGITLPSMTGGLDRAALLAWLAIADSGPFSTVAAGERVGYHTLEMMNVLAAAASVTERVGLMATVSVLPMHSAVHVAKQAATIDVISGGRFTLGVGVGGREEDYRLYGAPFARRHAKLDEQIEQVRATWAGTPPVVDTHAVGPQPVQAHGRTVGPRILSASMGPKGMARAARWADGLAGFDLTADPAGIAAAARAFEAAWDAAGRTGKPFLQSSAWFALGPGAPDTVAAYVREYLTIYGGGFADQLAAAQPLVTAAAIALVLQAAADAGIDEFLLVATDADVDDARRAADAVASWH